jgi:hypothetical protein
VDNEFEDRYFSEREGEVPAADQSDVGSEFWGGLVSLVQQRIGNNAFAESFPVTCSDTGLPHDTDVRSMGRLFKAEIRTIEWPLDAESIPTTSNALNAIEFFWRNVSEVTDKRAHTSRSWGFQHHHLISFDRTVGRREFCEDVNRLLRRCAHPYYVDERGRARRRLAPTAQAAIRKTHFQTGDADLDRLLSDACEKFESPDISTQREALEKLWDAWERLKSVLSANKASSVKRLLDEFVAEPRLRGKVESDANDLTWIGNNLMIRHTEVDRPAITQSEHVDYLFLRLFALISSILRSRGWATST